MIDVFSFYSNVHVRNRSGVLIEIRCIVHNCKCTMQIHCYRICLQQRLRLACACMHSKNIMHVLWGFCGYKPNFWNYRLVSVLAVRRNLKQCLCLKRLLHTIHGNRSWNTRANLIWEYYAKKNPVATKPVVCLLRALWFLIQSYNGLRCADVRNLRRRSLCLLCALGPRTQLFKTNDVVT